MARARQDRETAKGFRRGGILGGDRRSLDQHRGLSSFRVFRLSKPNRESRRADSNRLPLLIESDNSYVAGYARACDCPYLGRSLFKCVHAMSDFGQPSWSAKQWYVKLLVTLTEKVSSVRLPFGGLAALQTINPKFCIIQHNNRVLLYTAGGGGNRGEEA